MSKKVISLFLSVLMLLSCLSMTGFAFEAVKGTQPAAERTNAPAGSSASAPEGYRLTESISAVKAASYADEDKEASLPRVLLIQDTLPWDSYANETVLNELGIEYDKTTTSNFIANVDLEQYGVVIFANDQQFSAYENYEDFKEYLELFAMVGGVIVFGACDNGWADGIMTADLPGGVQKSGKYLDYENYISDYKHPIVTGELSDYDALTDEDLVGTYCSHTYFYENTLPAGSRVILRSSDNNAPTLVEYPLENGRVIASGLTWEYGYEHVGNYSGGYTCSDYAVKALEDLFLYAIRVSNIQVDELHRLSEYRFSANAHHIIVSDRTSNAIQGATVTVDDTEYTTDSNGSVAVEETGKKTVKVTAKGYQTLQLTYTLAEGTARIFFLTEEDALKLPYITGIQDVKNEYDYMSQKIYYPEGKDDSVTIKMTAEWNGKTPERYVLFQTDKNGKNITHLVSSSGEFVISPGTEFKPGYDVKARLYASDGTASKEIRTGIVIQENTVETQAGDVENLTSFRLFEDTNATLNDNNATKLLPSNWSVKIDALPIEVKKSYDPDDGSSTIKGTVGLVGKKWTNDLLDDDGFEGEWWNFKQKIEEAKKVYPSRQEIINKYKEGMSKSKLKSQVDAKFEAVGYFELKLNAFGEVVKSSGGLIIKAGGSYTYGGTFTAGPIPLYYEIAFGANIDGSIGLKFTYVDGSLKPGFEGSLSITIPDITIGGGVGVYGVAQVGLEGNGALKMDIAPSFKLTLSAKASVKIKVLLLAEYKWQLGKEWKRQLWPKEDAKAAYAINEMYEEAQEEDEVTVSPVSDDYTYYTSWWYGYSDVLQEWVLPDTTPEIVELGNNLMALFQTNLYGNVKLVYSIYDGYSWSSPKPVADDATYDLYFKPITVNSDNVYVVWQKLSSDILYDDDIENVVDDASANSEIYVAKWNSENSSFDDAVALTSNSSLDMLPRVATTGARTVAAWVNDPSNSIMGGSSVNYINYAISFGAAWSKAQTICTVAGSVSDFAVGFVNGNVAACYIVDGIVYSSESDAPLTDEESVASGITYYNGAFYWCSDGIVYSYSNNSITAVTPEDVAVDGSFRIVKGNKTAMVWAVNEARRGVIYASIDLGDHWSNPIEVFSDERYAFSYFDAHMSSNGAWYAMIDAVSETDYGQKTSILFHSIDELSDVALDYAYASEDEREGDNQPIVISVVNRGDSTVSSFNVSVEGENVSEYETISCNIEPGATESFIVDVDVSDITGETELYVSLEAGDECNYSNNYAEVSVGLVDAAIDIDCYFNENEIIVAAEVSNNGRYPMNASISVIEDSETGIVIDMKNLGVVETDEKVLYLYTFSPDEIDFNENASKNYVFRVDTYEGDYNEQNNTDIAIIYDESFAPGSEDDSQQETGSYLITFDPNGGTMVDYVTKVTYDNGTVDSLAVAVRDGYTFSGWYTAPEGGVLITAETVFTDNITLYAHWTASGAEHHFSPIWSYDENAHWRMCTDPGCDLVTDHGTHAWDNGQVIKPATVTESGETLYVCSVCGTTMVKTIEKTEVDSKLIGDVDGNGQITAADARLALRAAVGLEVFNDLKKAIADVDRNGTVTAADARLILRAAVGLEDPNKWY